MIGILGVTFVVVWKMVTLAPFPPSPFPEREGKLVSMD